MLKASSFNQSDKLIVLLKLIVKSKFSSYEFLGATKPKIWHSLRGDSGRL